MRKYIILFFSVLSFLFACKWSGTPSGIIEQDEMANLLTEVHLADGTILTVAQAPDSLYKYGTARYLVIFKKFNTDSAQFRKSYKYYTTRPEKMIAIYDQVAKNLSRKTDSVTALLAKQNTSNFGKKPFLPTTAPGKMMSAPAPGANGKPIPGRPPVPYKMAGRPGQPQNINEVQAAMYARLQARKDSLHKKHLKHKNALPKK